MTTAFSTCTLLAFPSSNRTIKYSVVSSDIVEAVEQFVAGGRSVENCANKQTEIS